MANKPKDYSDPPTWPRLMTADLACRYVSYSRNGFVRRVGETWPEPIRVGGKVLRIRASTASPRHRQRDAGAADGILERRTN